MPAGTSSRVGSSAMSDAEGTTVCPRSSKKLSQRRRISADSISGPHSGCTSVVVRLSSVRRRWRLRSGRSRRAAKRRCAGSSGSTGGVCRPSASSSSASRWAMPSRTSRAKSLSRWPASIALSAALRREALGGQLLELAVDLGGGPDAGGGAGGEPERTAEHRCVSPSSAGFRRRAGRRTAPCGRRSRCDADGSAGRRLPAPCGGRWPAARRSRRPRP